MTQTMNSFVTELSKQVGDWFEGTLDTNATNPTYTLVDSALAEKQAAWITSARKLAFRDEVLAMKAYAVKINEGKPNEEMTVKASYHICHHDTGEPCEAEIEI